MKKVLYGTTALVAAGLAAGQASADSGGIKLGISGYYRASAGILIGGDKVSSPGGSAGLGDYGRTSGGFRQEIRINFKGETTLDNGITVGVLVGLNPASGTYGSGSAANSVLNRADASFSGKYGDFHFGSGTSTVEASQADCVYDPGNVTANFGVNSANENFSNAGLGAFKTGGGKLATTYVGVAALETALATCVSLGQKGTGVAYFSPTFGGFSFAVSYQPSSHTVLSSGSQGFGAGTDLNNKRAQNVVEVMADFNHDFGGGFTLTAGGGGEWAFSGHTAGGGTESDKPSSYLLGFQVGIPGGFSVGASGQYFVNYNHMDAFAATNANAGTGGVDGWAGAVGGSYTIDAVSVGLEGVWGQYKVNKSTTDGHDNIWAVGLTGAYALGPGISLEGMVAYSKYDPANGTPSSTNPMAYDAVEVDAGVAINF